MLKPLEVMSEIDQDAGLPVDDRGRRQEKLLDVLLNPYRADSGEEVLSVFAHGPEAMRVALYPESSEHFAHYAVQTWSLGQEIWVTQKSYDPASGEDAALKDASSWYPTEPWLHVESKWQHVSDQGPSGFSSRAELAEFWYETRAAGSELAGVKDRYFDSPWPIADQVAEAAFGRQLQGVMPDAEVLQALDEIERSWVEEGNDSAYEGP